MKNFALLLLFSSLFIAGCSYTTKIRDGQTAYERKQYDVAIDFLQKEFKKAERRTEKGKIAYLLGESYDHNGRPDLALPWFKTAYDNGYGVDALREYAFALKTQERYDEALEAFEQLGMEIGSPYEYRREVTACKVAADWLKEENKDYRITHLAINSPASDYAPLPFRENELLFTSDRGNAEGKENYKWTGRSFMDIFVTDLSDNSVEAFSNIINTAENEGTASFSKDFSEMYFTRCYGDVENVSYCKILTCTFENGSWSAPRPLEFEEEKVNYVHPSLSEDGNFLYFASDHTNGWGGYDIYVSERTPTGWDIPRLMGRSINTPGNEVFPFVDADTLYFSSDHHTGMGGLDVFRVYKLNNETWSSPYNLKPPVNSGADDFAFVVDYRNAGIDENVLLTGYFTTKRPEGSGSDDIFKFEKIIPPPQPEPEPAKPVEYTITLNVFVLEKIFQESGNPNSKVLGRKPLQGASVKMTTNGGTKSWQVDESGFVTMTLDESQDYSFFASREGYLSNQATFSTKGIGRDPNQPNRTFDVEIVLDKIYKNKEIVLENIYYDFDKWDIREDAQPTLNKLVQDLKLNPEIRIQLASHTDCRGNDDYNEELSQKRAQSAVDYLIQKGIQPDRLVAKGFGESVPAVNCACSRCTEEEHQANRRTTFTILE